MIVILIIVAVGSHGVDNGAGGADKYAGRGSHNIGRDIDGGADEAAGQRQHQKSRECSTHMDVSPNA